MQTGSTRWFVKDSGLSPCSGVIIGMKETFADVIEMARSLKELDADSIPVNFLHAIDGSPLEGTNWLTPHYFKGFMPTKEIRISGGREVNLRSWQPIRLYPANSIFIGDYLTTEGQEGLADKLMLEDMGFEVVLAPLGK